VKLDLCAVERDDLDVIRREGSELRTIGARALRLDEVNSARAAYPGNDRPDGAFRAEFDDHTSGPVPDGPGPAPGSSAEFGNKESGRLVVLY
jgi:hypothetical protein